MTLSFLHSSLGAESLGPLESSGGRTRMPQEPPLRGSAFPPLQPPSFSLHSPGPPLPQARPLKFLFWARGGSAGCRPPPRRRPPPGPAALSASLTHTLARTSSLSALLGLQHCPQALPHLSTAVLSCRPPPPFPFCPCSTPPSPAQQPPPTSPVEPASSPWACGWPHLPGLTRGSGLGYFLLVPSPPSNTLLPSRKVQSSPCRLSHSPPPASAEGRIPTPTSCLLPLLPLTLHQASVPPRSTVLLAQRFLLFPSKSPPIPPPRPTAR